MLMDKEDRSLFAIIDDEKHREKAYWLGEMWVDFVVHLIHLFKPSPFGS